MMYQTCLLLVTIAASAMAMDLKNPEMKKLAEECATEVGVDLKEMEAIADKHDHEAWKKLFENHDFRCHSKCMSMKMGFMDDKGDANIEKVKETFKLTDEENIKILTDCVDKNKQEDLCDRAYEIQHCAWSTMKHSH